MILALILILSLGAFAQLPDAPSRSLTRIERTAMSLDIAATYADALASSTHTDGCTEVNTWLYSAHPSPRRYALTMTALTAGVEFVAYKLRTHSHKRLALALTLGDAVTHADGVISNYTKCR